MKSTLAALLATIVLAICPPVFGDSETIYWYHADFPPAFILSGEDKGTGYCDQMEADVTASLEDYNHAFVVSNYQRIVHSLQLGLNVCCASIYKTPEREKFSAYSKPLFIGLSNGIILLKENVSQYEKYITSNGEFDLKRLLQGETDIHIGVISGRNYGPSLEAAIGPFRKSAKIDERSGNDSQGLVDKLLKKRVDMILALPMEIAYVSRQHESGKERFAFFPIKDGKQYTISYMACPDNKWGRAVIARINAVIDEKRAVFAGYYRSWLDDSSARAYDALVKKVFGFLPAH